MADELVIVAGTFTVDPARRAEFLEGELESSSPPGRTGVPGVRHERRRRRPGLVRLFEMWSSMDDLQAHVQRIRSSPPGEGGVPVLARDMKIYVHAQEQAFGAYGAGRLGLAFLVSRPRPAPRWVSPATSSPPTLGTERRLRKTWYPHAW